MSQPSSDPTTTAPVPPPKRRSLFAFFFKSALGCTAFAFGSFIALILLLPTLLSGPAGSKIHTDFEKYYRGSIEIGDTRLGWFHPLEVHGIVLRDPDQHEVAHADLVLPSLWDLIQSPGKKIGRVMLQVDADLVADDQGITNLQKALEPRVSSAPAATPKPDSEAFDPIAWLARLELDLDVKSRKLSWSDVDTRRVGTPFEVHDLVATVHARPGQPIQAHVGGRVVADQPGSLEMDATMAGPIDSKKAWPFGKIDAKGSIEGFSTAMIDGLARCRGGLKELFGARFALRFKASNVTPESGDLEFALDGEKAGIAVSGRFADGMLRSTEKPGVVASFPPPRRFIDLFVKPNLPVGAKVWLDPDARPWTLRVPRFAVPIPPAGAHDLATLRPMLAKAEMVLDIDVPSHIAFENDATRQMATPVAVSATHVALTLAPNAPAALRFESALDTGVPGKMQIDATLSDWIAILESGGLPTAASKSAPNATEDVVQARISGLSTAAIGALAGQRELVRDAIGPIVDVTFDARGASLDADHLALTVKADKLSLDAHADVKDGLVRCAAADRITLTWRAEPEVFAKIVKPYMPAGADVALASGPIVLDVRGLEAPFPSAQSGDLMAALAKQAALELHLTLPGGRYSDETLRAANAAVSLADVDLAVKLAAGGQTNASLHAALDTGAKGKLTVALGTTDAWRFLRAGALSDPPPVDVHVLADGIATATIDALAAQKGLVTRALGDKLSISIEAKNANLKSGDLRLDVQTPNVALAFSGTLESGVLRASGEHDLHATAKIPAALVAEQLKPFMPAGAAVTWPNDTSEVRLSVRELSLVVPAFGAPNPKPFDLAALLESMSAKVHVELPGAGWNDEHTRAAKLDVGLRDLVVDATIAPKTPLVAKVGARLVPGKNARVDVDATLREPFFALKGAAMSPVDAKIVVTGLDTGTLDALAAQGGLLAGVLGPEIALTLDAQNASANAGTFKVDVKSETTTLHAAAKLAANAITCTGDDGLDLSIALKPAFVESRTKDLLPQGTHLRLEENAGPITVKLRDLRVPLSPTVVAAPAATKGAGGGSAAKSKSVPASTADSEVALTTMLEQVSKLALKLDATFPALVYSDAATDAAKKPIALRDVRIDATLAPTTLPSAKITGHIVDDPPGEISADVRALDPLAKLAEANGLDSWRAKISLRATKVPTAIVDLLAAQKGLLVEALGPRMEASVDAPEISFSQGAFVADMKSDLHSVHAEGHLEQRAANATAVQTPTDTHVATASADSPRIVIDKVDGLLARVAVGPLLSEKVIGKLVPMLFDLEKPPGSEPAKFAVDSMSFPLDGDLSKLDAVVRVDLGEVSYKLLPGLDSIVGKSLTATNVKVPPLTVPIKKGIASYDKLAIKIAGRDLLFSGTFNLVDQSFKLGTDVPLEILGKGFGSELEAARGLLDAKTVVPLEIRGTWKNPSVRVGKEFLDKLIKGAEKKGLEGLINGLGKKKKKD